MAVTRVIGPLLHVDALVDRDIGGVSGGGGSTPDIKCNEGVGCGLWHGLAKAVLSIGSPHFCKMVPLELPISAKSPLQRRDWADTLTDNAKPKVSTKVMRNQAGEKGVLIKGMA